MRGEASRIADRESRDSLAPKLRDTREDAWRIGNERFVQNAPEAVVAMERKKKADAEEKIKSLEESIAALKK